MICEGNACGVVDIVWDEGEGAYRIANRSQRPVLVSLTTSSGEISVQLESSSYTIAFFAEFDLPYRALFSD
jgi:hypothetical protein